MNVSDVETAGKGRSSIGIKGFIKKVEDARTHARTHARTDFILDIEGRCSRWRHSEHQLRFRAMLGVAIGIGRSVHATRGWSVGGREGGRGRGRERRTGGGK